MILFNRQVQEAEFCIVSTFLLIFLAALHWLWYLCLLFGESSIDGGRRSIVPSVSLVLLAWKTFVLFFSLFYLLAESAEFNDYEFLLNESWKPSETKKDVFIGDLKVLVIHFNTFQYEIVFDFFLGCFIHVIDSQSGRNSSQVQFILKSCCVVFCCKMRQWGWKRKI